ncbi:MAG: CapA family protein [Dehalococcoidia bacterium]|nr:CapA family protein [Dehalococcoidia bacterium]MCB9486950.1 CapA family protein [Thermoflexaceae bacterium]
MTPGPSQPKYVLLLGGAAAIVIALVFATMAAAVDSGVTETSPLSTTAVESPALVATTATATPTVAEAAPILRERRAVTLAAVGDVMLGRTVASAITASHPDGPFAGVADLLRSADLAVANLECVVSELGSPEPKAYTFAAPPAGATGLATAGIDLVSLANNHSLDFGADGLADSIANLSNAGLKTVGAGRNDREAWDVELVEVNGTRFAFLALAEVPDEAAYDMHAWTAGPSSPGIAWVDEQRMRSAIKDAGSWTDVVVVMLHFGSEGTSVVSERQRTLAHAAVDAGARLVLGSHPYVLQEVEDYNNGVIAYSLGNFVFDGFDGLANESGILNVTFEPGGSVRWRLQPVSLDGQGLPSVTG